MAYIAPNTDIQFFGDLGLNANYNDTKFFTSRAAKDNYFAGITKLATAAACTYTRGTRGIIRVQIPMATLINAQYMRFKNSSFENKWFYAFVLSVEYVNNETTEIKFQLDVLMTWAGDYTMGLCYVERQHSLTDAIGDNIADEKLDYGEYTFYNSMPSGFFNDHDEYHTVVATTLQADGESYPTAYNLYDGVYCGANVITWNTRITAGKQNLDAFFNKVNKNDLSESIVSVYEIPQVIANSITHDPLAVTPILKPYTTIDGYTPKNKKLFCYPYNLLRVSNCEGDFKDYRYEFFSSPVNVYFEIIFSKLPPAQCELYPLSYKGVAKNYQESLSMTNFPTGAYVNDSYKAYLAQSKSNALIKGAAGIIGAGAGALTGNPFSAAQGIGAVSGAIGEAVQPTVEKIANRLSGRSERAGHAAVQTGTPTVNVFYANDAKDYYFNGLQITAEYAKIIDDYFTMFGYRQDKIMTPVLNARPYYTYVKTIDCVIHGNLPADDAAAIEKIFDAGVRFWMPAATIGDYTVNNAPA